PRSQHLFILLPRCNVAKITAKAQKNPTALLAILLVAHMMVVSLNRAPRRLDGVRYVQIWVMTALMPVQWAAAQVSTAISNGWNHYVALGDARAENDRLRSERAQLEAGLLEAREQIRLAEQLQALKEWQARAGYPAVQARVIARDASQWFNSVIIDRGTIAGVQKDQPVITPEGLVGRVIYAGPAAARVLLLTDERHGAGAIIGQLADTRVLGVIKGRNESRCEIRFFSSPDKIASGELVLTSGQDGLYPRGLVIGRILRPEGEASSQAAMEVEPAAPLDKLDLVAVMLIPPGEVRARAEDLIEAERRDRVRQDAPVRRRR
ncbi:MAG: rod shape-determining protein MreC, partial [Acidobacteria bacterium]|nr:rod shape-determining protein MreC [Acidobacteriota bacterium]